MTVSFESGTTLVLGGARSGKSTWAERQFANVAVVDYVATAERFPDDAEWQYRIQMHRERRPATWRTLETRDVSDVLNAIDPAPVLVDCLALWLNWALDSVGAWDNAPQWRGKLSALTTPLVEAVRETTRNVILVSNEVGMGVVPATFAGRVYRDELGRLNAMVADVADSVVMCTAGIAWRVK